jgi:hypothetical protein
MLYNNDTLRSPLFWDVTRRRLVVTNVSALSVPSSKVKQSKFSFECLTLEDGADNLSSNTGNELPIYTA